jgi:hypothetical protein
MSAIRWLGLAIAILTFFFVFNRFRYGRVRKFDLILGSVFSVGLALVSVRPDSVNALRDFLLLEQTQFSRLIAISIISNILLWLMLFYTRFRQEERVQQFDQLVRRLGLVQFEQSYPQVKKFRPITVVIPAFNEEENIGVVLKQIPREVCGLETTVLVVDDGSTDQTHRIAESASALVIRNPIQRGGGAALRLGFDTAKLFESEIIVTMDADGQHLPDEMERLVKPIVQGDAEFVIGSRILGKREKDNPVRFIGIHVFNYLIRLLTPVKITDCSNGYRALRVETLDHLRLEQDQFHTSEFIIDAARKGIKIGEVPVTVKKRLSGSTKKGRDVTYGLWFIRAVLKSWWR